MLLRAPNDMEVMFRFYIGKELVNLSVAFCKGENAEEIIRQLCTEEGIPAYKEHSLLATLSVLFKEERRVMADDADAVRDERRCLEGAIRWADAFARETVRYRTKTHASETLSLDLIRHENVAHMCTELSEEMLEFTAAYRLLTISSWTTVETLIDLEDTFAMAVGDLLSQKKASLDELAARQLREMEVVNLSMDQGDAATQGRIQTIVENQVQEKEELEKKWKQRIEELMESQKSDFREFVMSLYRLEEQEGKNEDASTSDGEEDGRGKSANATDTRRHSITPQHRRATPSPPRPTTPPPPDHEEVRGPGTLRRIFRLGLFGGGGSGEGDHKGEDRRGMEGRMPESIEQPIAIQETYTAHIGTQLKTPYTLILSSEGILDNCRRRKGDIDTRADTIMRLYMEKLSGAVMLTDTTLDFGHLWDREFIEICQASTDFHFDSVELQLARARACAASAPMGTGDVVVTRHSNLANLHVIFHLCLDTKDDGDTPLSLHSALMAGLRNILCTCERYDVAKLFLPIHLMYPAAVTGTGVTTETRISNTAILRRVNVVLRCIKAFLVENSMRPPNLRTFHFLLPNRGDDFLRHCKAHLFHIFPCDTQ